MIKFLFFDYQELEWVRGLSRQVERPRKWEGNPLFVADAPWQRGDMQLYGSVVRTPDGRFHLWYQGHTVAGGSLPLYAESDDGIAWRRPELDVVRVDGAEGVNGARTNAVLPDAHGTAVLYDPADPREDWRFKLVTGARPSNCISAFHSADGVHWTPAKRGPVIGSNPDCPMGFLRAPDGRYVLYHRIWGHGRRVFRSESWDFLQWGEPFVPRGERGAWDDENLHCASQPVYLENEIRYYFAGTRARHGQGWKVLPERAGLGMARLRPDGFVALVAGDEEGELLTAAFRLPGGRISLNAATERDGWVRVELLAMEGGTIRGWELDACVPFSGDSPAHELRWERGGASAAEDDPTGRWVLLRLRARNARVYSVSVARPGETAPYWEFEEANPQRNHAPTR